MTCCCNLTGTMACENCSSRTIFKDWDLLHGFTSIEPEWKRQQREDELQNTKGAVEEYFKKKYCKVETECPACNGTKIQERKSDGLKVLCPACDGKGKI